MGVSLKALALLLILALLASSLLVVESSSAVLIPKPSPPEFTVYLVNHPYDVPATLPVYTTDPYTGETKNVTSGSPGYRADNVSIEIWILNKEPGYSNGTTVFTPYYDVRTKGHYEQGWREFGYSFTGKIKMESNENRTFIDNFFPIQYGSKYTVLTVSSDRSSGNRYDDFNEYPANATVDFQVKVSIGYSSPMMDYHGVAFYVEPFDSSGTALATQSDWSQTQSITVNLNNTVLASTLENPTGLLSATIILPTDTPKTTATPNPITTATSKPTPTNSIDNSSALSMNTWLLIIAVIAFFIISVLVLLFIRNRKLKGSQEVN